MHKIGWGIKDPLWTEELLMSSFLKADLARFGGYFLQTNWCISFWLSKDSSVILGSTCEKNRWAKFPGILPTTRNTVFHICVVLQSTSGFSLAVSFVVPVVSVHRSIGAEAKVLKHPSSLLASSNRSSARREPKYTTSSQITEEQPSRVCATFTYCVNFVTQTSSHHFTFDFGLS